MSFFRTEKNSAKNSSALPHVFPCAIRLGIPKTPKKISEFSKNSEKYENFRSTNERVFPNEKHKKNSGLHRLNLYNTYALKRCRLFLNLCCFRGGLSFVRRAEGFVRSRILWGVRGFPDIWRWWLDLLLLMWRRGV